ncbi:MAG TPA: DMT family transporter [Chlamydiales bacterium]|nr:DMT family transporter [Chlamydiales bacterium]
MDLRKGIYLTLLASLFYLLVNGLASRLDRFPIAQILFLQNITALVCLLPFAWQKMSTPLWKLHLIRDFSGLASYFLIFQALKTCNLVDVTTLHFTSPFFVPFISFIWFKEKISSSIWGSIAIGFIGVVTILNPSQAIFKGDSLFALLAAIAGAIGISAVRNLNLHQEPIERILFFFFAVGTLITLPFAYSQWLTPTPQESLLLSLVGIFALLNHLFVTRAFFYAPASYLASLSYTAILYAALFGWIFLNEPIGLRSLFGSLLIIAGGCITYFNSLRKPQGLLPKQQQ